jgi:hypothetical protein
MQKFYMDRFNIKELNDVEVEQNQVKMNLSHLVQKSYFCWQSYGK